MVEVERPVTGADPVGPGTGSVLTATGTSGHSNRPGQRGRAVVCKSVDQTDDRYHATGAFDSPTHSGRRLGRSQQAASSGAGVLNGV